MTGHSPQVLLLQALAYKCPEKSSVLSLLRGGKYDSLAPACAQATDGRWHLLVATAANVRPLPEGLAHDHHQRRVEAEELGAVRAFFAPRASKPESAPATAAAATGMAPPPLPPHNSPEEGTVAIINEARCDPARFIQRLRHHLRMFVDDTHFMRGGSRTLVCTSEGKACVRYAIKAAEKVLRQRVSGEVVLRPLRYEPCLNRGCQDHCDDQARTGATGHDGADGSRPQQRAERHCELLGGCGENIAYGQKPSQFVEQVLSLYIDDGVPSRGHRANILSPRYGCMGLAFGPHRVYGHSCVHAYACDARPKSAAGSAGGPRIDPAVDLERAVALLVSVRSGQRPVAAIRALEEVAGKFLDDGVTLCDSENWRCVASHDGVDGVRRSLARLEAAPGLGLRPLCADRAVMAAARDVAGGASLGGAMRGHGIRGALQCLRLPERTAVAAVISLLVSDGSKNCENLVFSPTMACFGLAVGGGMVTFLFVSG